MASIKIAVLRTELSKEDKEQLKKQFPGDEVDFVDINPESTTQTVELLNEKGPFAYTAVRPETLVEMALELGHRFILPGKHGPNWVELLVAPPVLTKPLPTPDASGRRTY